MQTILNMLQGACFRGLGMPDSKDSKTVLSNMLRAATNNAPSAAAAVAGGQRVTTSATGGAVNNDRKVKMAAAAPNKIPISLQPTAAECLIVLFKPKTQRVSMASMASSFEKEHKIGIHCMYNSCVKGFAGSIPQNHISYFLGHPDVQRIEYDRRIYAMPMTGKSPGMQQQTHGWGVYNKASGAYSSAACVSAAAAQSVATATNAAAPIRKQDVPWGVRVVGGRNSELNMDGKFITVPVDIYILDTGVQQDHPDLNLV